MPDDTLLQDIFRVVNELRGDIRALSKKMDDNRREVMNRIADVDRRVGYVKQSITTLDDRLDHIEKRLDHVPVDWGS